MYKRQTSISEGVEIALVLDRSSSMQHVDMDSGGEKTRLDVVKEVVGDFARRRMTDREGAADHVALFTFARFPELLCPFTLDAEALEGFLETVQLVEFGAEDGTAIGVALAKAVAVLRESDAESKVVVLLTDGENNETEITPLQAAELAAEHGIRVYTVLAGRYVYVQDWFGRIQPSERELDSTELEAIAETTGGRFFRARDRRGLEEVYAEIESLERTPREDRPYVDQVDHYPRFLILALLSYFAAWATGATVLRRLP